MRTGVAPEAGLRPHRLRGRRDIGPAGTLARLAMGVTVLEVGTFTDTFTNWNVAFGLLGLPVVALLTLRILSSFDDGVETRCSEEVQAAQSLNDRWLAELILLGAVTLVVTGVSLVTPVTEGSVWVWLGVSFVLAAVEGQAGCEMVTLPNLLSRKRYRVPCFLFVSIDRWESHCFVPPARLGSAEGGEQPPPTANSADDRRLGSSA